MPKIFQTSKPATENLGATPLIDPQVGVRSYQAYGAVGRGLKDIAAFGANVAGEIGRAKGKGEASLEKVERDKVFSEWNTWVSSNQDAPFAWEEEWELRWSKYESDRDARAKAQKYSVAVKDQINQDSVLFREEKGILVEGAIAQGDIGISNNRLMNEAMQHFRNDRFDEGKVAVESMDAKPSDKDRILREAAGAGQYARLEMEIMDLTKLSEVKDYRSRLNEKDENGNFIMGEREEGGVSIQGRETLNSRLKSTQIRMRGGQISTMAKAAKEWKAGTLSIGEIKAMAENETIDLEEANAFISFAETVEAVQVMTETDAAGQQTEVGAVNDLLNLSTWERTKSFGIIDEISQKDSQMALSIITNSKTMTRDVKMEMFNKYLNALSENMADKEERGWLFFWDREMTEAEFGARTALYDDMKQRTTDLKMDPLMIGYTIRLGEIRIAEAVKENKNITLEELKEMLTDVYTEGALNSTSAFGQPVDMLK